MPNPTRSHLAPMLDKLLLWRPLDDADRAAVLALPHSRRRMSEGEFMVREGDRPITCSVLLAGLAFRHKSAGNGGRQIFSIHTRGDIVDLHNSFLGWADHNLEALTDVETAAIPIAAVEALMAERPAVARALWYETLVDGSIFREWTLNIGRRTGRQRLAHMLCEFGIRLEAVGLGQRHRFELPMTQEQLADVLALTPVHVNRVLQSLGSEGLITRTKRAVVVEDWHRLTQVGDFDPGYLHLYQREAAANARHGTAAA